MTPTEREANEDYRDILCELDSRLDELRALIREYPPLDVTPALKMLREFALEWQAFQVSQRRPEVSEHVFTISPISKSRVLLEWIRPNSKLVIVWDEIDTSSWFILKPDGSRQSGVITHETPAGFIVRLIKELEGLGLGQVDYDSGWDFMGDLI